MNAVERFDLAALWDLKGQLVCRVRVPTHLGVPEIILWGNRYFTKSIPYGNWREGRVYMVPLEDMHAGEAVGPKSDAGGAKK